MKFVESVTYIECKSITRFFQFENTFSARHQESPGVTGCGSIFFFAEVSFLSSVLPYLLPIFISTSSLPGLLNFQVHSFLLTLSKVRYDVADSPVPNGIAPCYTVDYRLAIAPTNESIPDNSHIFHIPLIHDRTYKCILFDRSRAGDMSPTRSRVTGWGIR